MAEQLDETPSLATQDSSSLHKDDGSLTSGDILDDAQIEERLRDADELKQDGNEAFRSKEWSSALVYYSTALAKLPKRKETGHKDPIKNLNETESGLKEAEDRKGKGKADTTQKPETTQTPEPIQTPLEAECSKARAILNANIGACRMKLGDDKAAVDACTEALRDDPKYVKALQRRAACNEKINSWSALSSAQEDYQTIIELVPSSSPMSNDAKRSLYYIKPRVEAAQKKETAEMMDKFKGLGNTILGKFGLSTDNFKFEPNGKGGYNMNFSQCVLRSSILSEDQRSNPLMHSIKYCMLAYECE
ncbi:hypothetical protein SERLA73DRAFT_184814 [Serpula lacrymans var. lacrymans S7.3]|uniref:Uncharacterized protein n=2 Tax=Serpula lacrymans var. lacrymans TaxID=341189 RepID=F8Q553_SERL3|nr:uncharacterized protein SERLADRAFT_472955 [Serpula lacrymans var. lacrymans S7.9]EGN96680.1 hypothetical protein SERLA73DRAFT_184814 [Serpula lacrymans var. lacrymans S7.3]EGO22298.1 hypothetical protein SERLADRAFT_472955 [Serpula lacrymans var. lacrymans S7.9]